MEKIPTKNRFMKLDLLPQAMQSRTRNFILINLLYSFAFHITDTFLVLYLAEFISYVEISIIFSIQMGIQLIFDFPTGVLGDYIGQKKILLSAYLLLAAGSVLLVVRPSFGSFIGFAILSGLGNSQFSGALDSWYDSHYTRECSHVDPERSIYGLIMGRLYSLFLGVAGVSVLISGVVANYLSRQLLFAIQVGFYGILFGVIYLKLDETTASETKKEDLPTNRQILIKQDNFDEEKESPCPKNQENPTISPRNQIKAYFQLLRSGLKYVFSRKSLIFFFLGIALYNAFLESIWTKLILFPVIKLYAVSDTLTGVIRWINLTLDIFIVSVLAAYSAKTKKKESGYLLALGGMLLCIGGLALYITVVPPLNTFSLGRFLGMWLINFSMAIPYRLMWLFYSRILIDMVPNTIRNSLYSLIPTLILTLAIPANIFGGYIIESHGFAAGILVVVIFATIGVVFQSVGLRNNRGQKV